MGTIKQNYANNITSGGDFDATKLDGTISNANVNNTTVGSLTTFGTAGTGVVSVASDPSPTSIGDVWFNTTVNKFRYSGAGVGSWATGGSLNDGRSQLAGIGTQTAALGAGGDTPGETANNESYDGTSWTEVNNLAAATRLGQGIGLQTAALMAGGYQPPGYQSKNESWDGTNWTETTNLNSNKGAGGGCGTQTAAIAFAGVPGGPMRTNELWDGSSWTEVGDLNSGRRHVAGVGISTAALAYGGDKPSPSPGALTEQWNGSTWTEVADLNTARSTLGWGVYNLAGATLGHTGSFVNNTELWDGTSWTEVADSATSRKEGGTSGTVQSAGLYFGGESPLKADTEEWTIPDTATKTVTAA